MSGRGREHVDQKSLLRFAEPSRRQFGRLPSPASNFTDTDGKEVDDEEVRSG